jgi:hypothetical protein
MSTVSSLITRRPLLPVITLKKNDASTYTYNPFTSTFDFRVTRLQVLPPFSNNAGSFILELTSSDASNSNSNILISNVDEGNEVTIWIGKDDASKMKVFLGVIESWEIQENNKNFMRLTIKGPDFGTDILKNRIVFGKWAQLLDSNGNPDSSDSSTTVRQIVIDMLTKETYYPDQTGLITAEDQGIIVTSTNIKGEDLTLKSFAANYEFIGDKLQSLGEIGGMIYWVDPDKTFYFDHPTTLASASSGVLLTDDNTDATAIAWLPTTHIGLIAPNATYERTLENHKRRVFGMGGVNVAIDQSSDTDAGTPTTLESYNYAMSFIPNYSTVSKIEVKISKIGTPVDDFVLELREDFNGLPTGKVLRSVSKPKAFLDSSGTTAVWSTFEINEEVIIGYTYWIVIKKNGTSSSHTFRWHHDNTNHGTAISARSATDGNPTPDWALLTTNKYYYAFKERKGDEVFRIYTQDPISATTKHHHDDIIRKDDVTDDYVMDILLTTETETLFKRKEIFKCQVYAPDVLLTAGEKVRIRKQAGGYTFDAEFVLGSVEYIFESGDDQSTGAFYYFIEAVRYVTIS